MTSKGGPPVARKRSFAIASINTFNWAGSPTKFLEEITAGLEKKVAASADWPKTVKMLGCELRRLARQLREHGIFVTFTKTRKSRLISITTRPLSDDDEYSSATP